LCLLRCDAEAAGNHRNGIGVYFVWETHKAFNVLVNAGYEWTDMIRVRVQKIESIRDPEGNLGKRIELIEERKIPRFAVRPSTEEARMVQGVVQALQQQLPMFPTRTQFSLPKMILFLTEQEYEQLGIDFDVNQIYELELSNQTLKFKKAP
jgi:hypothetical protein